MIRIDYIGYSSISFLDLDLPALNNFLYFSLIGLSALMCLSTCSLFVCLCLVSLHDVCIKYLLFNV